MGYLHSHSCILRRRTSGATGHATAGLALLGLPRDLQVQFRISSFSSSHGSLRAADSTSETPKTQCCLPPCLNREAARWAMRLRLSERRNMPADQAGLQPLHQSDYEKISVPGDSLGATRPQERRAAPDILFLDCWVNAPSLVCLDRRCKHSCITSPPASGPKTAPRAHSKHGITWLPDPRERRQRKGWIGVPLTLSGLLPSRCLSRQIWAQIRKGVC